MSREIKFRVILPDWTDKVICRPENFGISENFKNTFLGIDLDGKVWDFDFNNGKRIERKDAVVMQFTGLKDKNGVEIYEGDIVKVDARVAINNEIIGDVRWFDCAFEIGDRIKTGRGNDYIVHGLGKNIKCEILGNIYQNKDLLK